MFKILLLLYICCIYFSPPHSPSTMGRGGQSRNPPSPLYNGEGGDSLEKSIHNMFRDACVKMTASQSNMRVFIKMNLL